MRLRSPQGDASVQPLVELIAAEIERTGPITFARFMELALGHAEYGYYASSAERVGPAGDFLTAPETHPVFGWLVARQIEECWRILGAEPELRIREDGAGRGTLAEQILVALSSFNPAGLETVRYAATDLNPLHADDLQKRLTRDGRLDLSIRRNAAERFAGIVLANELLDALPFHRLMKSGRELVELWVTLEDGWFVAQPGRLSPAATSIPVDVERLGEGQIVEVAPRVPQWFDATGNALERGFVIVFDYGYERPELFDAGRFPRGTLKTYRRHEVGDNPFQDIGQRDITAHVDFTVVRERAGKAGLTFEGLTTLAAFSAGLGLDEFLLEVQTGAERPEVYLAARTAAMELLDPAGLGRFRVAILSKGVEIDRQLRGLGFRLPGR